MQYLQRFTPVAEKLTGRTFAKKMTELFHIIRRKEAIPQEFKDATISTYSKGKGIVKSLTIIGASLYSQLLERSLLESHWIDWMNTLNSKGFYQKQCGFRKDRGTTDIIFTARQLQEKCQEQNSELYMTFVDLTKAFDTINHEGLESYGKVWLSCQNQSNGAAVPRWYACTGPE